MYTCDSKCFSFRFAYYCWLKLSSLFHYINSLLCRVRSTMGDNIDGILNHSCTKTQAEALGIIDVMHDHMYSWVCPKRLHDRDATQKQKTLPKSRSSWKENVTMLFWQISGVLWQSLLCYSLLLRSLYCSHFVDCCWCYQSLFSSWRERLSFILDKNLMFYSIYRVG